MDGLDVVAQALRGMEPTRCPWLPVHLGLYRHYHDTEWGVPCYERRTLFEMICLEGAQAGLSWWTVLQKRERYRAVFHQFDPATCALMRDAELDALLQDPGIIRHRGKIWAVRQNARAWLELEAREGDAVRWLWSFVGGAPKVNQFRVKSDFPAKTPESDALSKALRKAGFNFVGSTTMYAFMQAVGMVDDHTLDCLCRVRQKG
jgi:DNA-3-methyladenine glycosylase I